MLKAETQQTPPARTFYTAGQVRAAGLQGTWAEPERTGGEGTNSSGNTRSHSHVRQSRNSWAFLVIHGDITSTSEHKCTRSLCNVDVDRDHVPIYGSHQSIYSLVNESSHNCYKMCFYYYLYCAAGGDNSNVVVILLLLVLLKCVHLPLSQFLLSFSNLFSVSCSL